MAHGIGQWLLRWVRRTTGEWQKLPQSTLKSAVEIESGKLVVTPVAGIDKLFLKVFVERASRPFEEWPTESPSFLNGQDARSTRGAFGTLQATLASANGQDARSTRGWAERARCPFHKVARSTRSPVPHLRLLASTSPQPLLFRGVAYGIISGNERSCEYLAAGVARR